MTRILAAILSLCIALSSSASAWAEGGTHSTGERAGRVWWHDGFRPTDSVRELSVDQPLESAIPDAAGKDRLGLEPVEAAVPAAGTARRTLTFLQARVKTLAKAAGSQSRSGGARSGEQLALGALFGERAAPWTDEDALVTMKAVEELDGERVRSWLRRARTRQASGESLSVLEHTALLHILRSDFLSPQYERTSFETARRMLERSWAELAGTPRGLGRILESRLPRRVLYRASREARQFHAAAFQRRDKRTGLYLTPLGFLKDFVPMPQDVLYAAGLAALAYWSPGTIVAIVAGWLVIGAPYEQFYHNFISHPSPAVKKWMLSHGKFGRYLYKISVSHGVVHHFKTYRPNYTRQFESAEDQARLDQTLSKKDALEAARIKKRKYGLIIESPAAEKMEMTILPFSVALAWLLGLGPIDMGILMLCSVAFIHHINLVHEPEHDPREEVLARSGLLMSLFVTSRYFTMINRQHFVHHMAPDTTNFNLLPGVDLLLGTLAKPTVGDLLIMREQRAFFF